MVRGVIIINKRKKHIFAAAVGVSLVSHTIFSGTAFSDSDFDVLGEYNDLSNSKWIPDEFAFESLNRLMTDSDDYLIVAGVETSAPMTAEALVVINNDMETKYIYMSSRLNRKVICNAENNISFELDFALEDPSGPLSSSHPQYMVMEKRFNGETVRFAFDNAGLDVNQKVDAFRANIFESMISSCTLFEVINL